MKNTHISTIVILTVCAMSSYALSQDECHRHADCDGDNVCIQKTCVQPDEALDECTNGACSDWHVECDEGYCKKDGVYCENEAGHCYNDNGWGSYTCGTGDSEAWMSEEPPDPLLSDEELYSHCIETLESSCGTEAPDILDACTEKQLEQCEEYYDYVNTLRDECGQEVEEIGYSQMAACCRDLEREDEFLLARMECVMSLDIDECEKLSDCWDDGEDSGKDDEDDLGQDAGAGSDSDADTDTDTDTDTDSDADSDSGPGDSDDDTTASEESGSGSCSTRRPSASGHTLIDFLSISIAIFI